MLANNKIYLREGVVYNRLTTIKELPSNGSATRWECECSCGAIKICRASDLASGRLKSCGCLHRDLSRERAKKKKTHGHTVNGISPEYRAWRHMINRCTNTKVEMYPSYGGRGIKVCAEWLHNFQAFYTHLGPRPSNQHSLDRIDTNGNYEPGNVRWATSAEQTRNKRSNINITVDGETKCITDWATTKDISDSCIRWRIASGWDPVLAVTTPRLRK